MTALPPCACGTLPLDLLFANANLPLWDRRLALERSPALMTGISAYLVKPPGVEEYLAAIRSLKELWFHVAALPPRHDRA